MFDDLNDIEKPNNSNAIAWYEYGIRQGLKQQDPKSKWIRNDNNQIVCRNCNYKAPYDVNRGFCCGSYCAQCGAKMEEFKSNGR